MNHQNKDTLYLYFKKNIDGEVAKVVEALEKDIEALKYEAKISIEQELKEEHAHLIDVTTTELSREYRFKMADLQREQDLLVMKKRRELLDELFTRLEQSLIQFRQSDDYLTWLTKKLSIAHQENWVRVQMDAADEVGMQMLKHSVEKVFGLIGGFIAYTKDGKNVIDESLKNRIDESKKWFYDHAQWFSDGEDK